VVISTLVQYGRRSRDAIGRGDSEGGGGGVRWGGGGGGDTIHINIAKIMVYKYKIIK
jgi:hypothetical protein